jgi:hypothetical protein
MSLEPSELSIQKFTGKTLFLNFMLIIICAGLLTLASFMLNKLSEDIDIKERVQAMKFYGYILTALGATFLLIPLGYFGYLGYKVYKGMEIGDNAVRNAKLMAAVTLLSGSILGIGITVWALTDDTKMTDSQKNNVFTRLSYSLGAIGGIGIGIGIGHSF